MEISLFIACIAGVISFTRLHECYRIVFVQVVIYLGAHILMWLLPFMLPPSHPVLLPQIHIRLASYIYTFIPFFEITLLLLAVNAYFKNKSVSRWLLCVFSLYVLISIVSIVQKGFIYYSYYPYITGGIVIVIASTIVLYKTMMDITVRHERRAGISISLGLMIYFGCSTPVLCMVDNLSGEHGFDLLIGLIFHTRYCLTAYAFWCFRKAPVQPFTY